MRNGPFQKGCLAAMVFALLVVLSLYAVRCSIQQPRRQAAQAYEAIEREYPFSPHESDEVTEDQLRRYAAVRAAVIPHLEKIVATIEQAREKKEQDGGGIGLAFSVGKQMLRLDANMKEAHIKALRDNAMSREQYRWIARRAFAALRTWGSQQSGDGEAEWLAVQDAFGASAPKTAKYRQSRPDLAAHFQLEDISPSEAEIAAVWKARDGIFSPRETLYHEITALMAPDDATERR